MPTAQVQLERNALKAFCQQVFQQLEVSEEDARIVADVLVTADAMGIPSHGVIRVRRYVNGLQSGLMRPAAAIETLVETPSSIVVNAHGAMGAPVSAKTMHSVIQKAKTNGSAFGCVRDSNHFGIAGYYARMALQENMLGIAMTNTGTLGVPTFGRQTMYGTNPIAFSVPDGTGGVAMQFDQSTTTVALGKITMAKALGHKIPLGWALDSDGKPTTDPEAALSGSLTSIGEHKGWGFGIMAEILAAGMTDSTLSRDVTPLKAPNGAPHNLGQFYVLIDPENAPSFHQRMNMLSSYVAVEDGVRLPGQHKKPMSRVEIVDAVWSKLEALAQGPDS